VLKLRGSSIADALITSLHFARSEALSRNERVVVCANTDTDPASANYPCNGNNWNSGWMAVLVSDSSVIKYWPVNSPGAQVSLSVGASVPVIAAADVLVVYNADGEARVNDGTGVAANDQVNAFSFTTRIANCDSPQLSIQRQIDVRASGLIRVSRGDCL